MGLDVKKTIRGHVPRIDFNEIAKSILGPRYSLSLVVCGDTLARRLNVEYRKKTYKPNVLSFPITRHEGEIILNLRKAEREARSERISTTQRVVFLFIHACLHLRGMDHGNAMDREERRHMNKAGF